MMYQFLESNSSKSVIKVQTSNCTLRSVKRKLTNLVKTLKGFWLGSETTILADKLKSLPHAEIFPPQKSVSYSKPTLEKLYILSLRILYLCF